MRTGVRPGGQRCFSEPPEGSPSGGKGGLVRDGATVIVRFDAGSRREIRLARLDVPQIDGRGGREECGAAPSAAALSRTLPAGSRVLVSAHSETRSSPAPARLIAGGRDVGRMQLQRGWAQVSLGEKIPPKGYGRAARRAQRRAVGVWGLCGVFHARGREPGSPDPLGFLPCDGGWGLLGASGDLFRDFSSNGADCATVRQVVRIWVRRTTGRKGVEPGLRPERPVRVLRWSCRAVFRQSSAPDPYLDGLCERRSDRARLQFQGGPIRDPG